MSPGSDTAFKALADPQRRRVLQMLRSGELPAGEIARRLGLTPATVSHHLAQLRGAELVRVRRAGQQRIYALNTSVVEDVMLLIKELLDSGREQSR
jgi:DNA-binding transcriptional ArsR family regulator